MLRVNTSERVEIRCWLTRRLVKRLWPVLERALGAAAPPTAQATPEARQAVVAFQREEALSKADFSQRFEEEPAEQPLGEEPILAAKARVQRTSAGHHLRLDPVEGQGMSLMLDDRLLHSLCELIARAVRVAEWDLELRPVEPASAQPVGPAN
jgi:hypothetical protein